MFHQELCLYHGTNHKVNEEDINFYLDHRMLKSLGSDQAKIQINTLEVIALIKVSSTILA
jgi:hypothetical protein